MSFIKNFFGQKSDHYDVFISYRRDGGDTFARMLKSELEKNRLQVYIDVDNLHSSYFDEQLLTVIDECTNFILILTPGSLERCKNQKDWMRREIVQAIESNCNIIPIFNKGFDFPISSAFPEELKNIPRYQSIEYSNQYHQAAIEKLISFLLKKKKRRIVETPPRPPVVPKPEAKQEAEEVTKPVTVTETKKETPKQEVTIGDVSFQAQEQEKPGTLEASIGNISFQSQTQTSDLSASIGSITFKRM